MAFLEVTKLRKLFSIVFVAGLMVAGPSLAKDYLGERVVNYGSEKDTILVPGAKKYRSVQLCVKVHAVRFRDVDAVFGNGGRQDFKLRRVIGKGECTRWINLRGPKRNITKIVLRYDTYGNAGPKARVIAYGR